MSRYTYTNLKNYETTYSVASNWNKHNPQTISLTSYNRIRVGETEEPCSTTYTDAIISKYLLQFHNKILLSIQKLGDDDIKQGVFDTLCSSTSTNPITATGKYNNIFL